MKKISRRNAIKLAAATAVSAVAAGNAAAKPPAQKRYKSGLPLPIGMNCGTLNGYNLKLEEQINLISKAGYDGIEPWTRHIEDFISRGNKITEVKKRLEDADLKPDNLIGFAKCMLDDPAERAKNIEQMKREIGWAAEIGSKNIACTMYGIEKLDPLKFDEYAERYAKVIELARPYGVKPLLELWGHRALHRLGDALKIAALTNDANAGLLLDFYHLYRGGNSFASLNLVNLGGLDVFHINDYPSSPAREKLVDADRVFPGDGICPFKAILPKMYSQGFRGCLSLELFNKNYWKQPPEKTLAEGYAKTKDTILSALVEVA